MNAQTKPTSLKIRGLMFVSAVMLMSACSKQAEEDNSEEKKTPAVPVEVAHAYQGDINAVYANTTTLEAEQEANVVAKASEIITELLVEEGDYVKKGQVLAVLNTDKLVLQVAQSEANLKRLKSELDRQYQMNLKKMVSADAYERTQYEYQAQQASHRLSKLELEYATIRAPISGVISERYVKLGNMVNVNQSLFKITDFEPLHAVIHVPEKELQKLKDNQLALVKVDAHQDSTYQGIVKRISPIVDSTSGTFKVTIEVNDPMRQLRPGMFGRVGIVYAQHNDALLINKNALIADEDKPLVYIVKDGVAHRTELTTGFVNGSNIEVLSGLAMGDQVVVAGQNSLKHESKVEILNQQTETTTVASAGSN